MNWHANGDAGWSIDWHGETGSDGVIPGITPDGIGSFALSLENGYTVTYRWPTDIIKTRSGKEQRISRNDRPKEAYGGKAFLLGDQAVETRATLARSAAAGTPILLGLQHEEALVTAVDSTDSDLPVITIGAGAMSECDWSNHGQRVFVVHEDSDDVLRSAEAVVQDSDATTLTVAPDDADAFAEVAIRGARIMPAMPVLLEPQQDFARYPLDAEIWNIRARAARFDFAMALASLDLGPLTAAAGLDSASVTARVAGSAPTFQMVADAIAGETLEETATGVVIHFTPGPFAPSSVADIYALLLTSTLVAPTGTWGAGTLDVADEVPETALAGGDTQGPVGTGASVTTYAGRPVWDREINIRDTNTDSVHAMTEIIDHGGVPYSVGGADVPDWGRAVVLTNKQRDDWQWWKLFMATVKGPQKAFWLSTWRDDLPFVSKATDTITVEGDVSSWYPRHRQHLQIWETSGTFTRAEIADAVDNGDGTWTLDIGTTLASSSVRMVSWLELCRFEKDEFAVTFGANGFSLSTIARVVQE